MFNNSDIVTKDLVVQVNRVDLVNSKSWGGRLWDFEVRVTDTLPTSGD